MKLHAVVEDAETARRAVAGGATVVQLRLKGRPTDEVVSAGGPLRRLCDESATTLVVNDDVEAALGIGADGVHLGRTDAGATRALAEGLLLGRSVATAAEALAAETRGAGYLGAGSVWATPTKPDADPPIGLEGLREICTAVSIPVVAIGGVNVANVGECIRAGAAGVAVIRAVDDAAALRRVIDDAL